MFLDPILLSEESRGQNTIGVATNQLENYLIEYENSKNTVALWFSYLIISSIEDNRNKFSSIINNNKNKYSFFSHVEKCIESILHDDNEQTFTSSFIYCIDNNTLKLSYLHDINHNISLYNSIFSSIDPNILSLKETYHYKFFQKGFFDDGYSLDGHNLSILDFYYFDKVSDYDKADNLNDFLNHAHNNLKNISILKSNNEKLQFLLSINAFYKLEREHDVYNISKLLVNYDDLPISKHFLRILNYISYSSYINGYYQYDIDLYRNLILPLTSILSDETNLRAKIDYGVSLYRIGNTSSSLLIFESIYENKDILTDNRYYSALLNNLGIAYLNVGYFEKYIQLQLDALKLSEDNNDLNQQIYFLNNLYIYHRRIQNWKTAIEYLQQVKARAELAEDLTRLAGVELAFGTFHRDYTRDIDLSLDHLYRSNKLASQSDEYNILVTSLIELAATYKIRNNFPSSFKFYSEAASLANEKNDVTLLVYINIHLANLFLEINDIESAEPYLETVFSYDRSKLPFSTQINRQTVISKSLLFQEKPDQALNILRSSAEDIVSRTVHSSDIQSGHIFLEKDYLLLFKLLAENLVKFNYLHEAIFWMDEIKNLSSVNFYNNPALKSSILSENELVLDFALRNRIERIRSQLRTASEDQRIHLNNLLLEAISEQNSLRRKVLQNFDLKPVNLKRLRRQLGRSDIILYFSIFDDHLYVSTISSGTFNIHQLSFSDDEINRIDALVKSLSSDKVKLTELAWIKNKIFKNIYISDRYTNYYIIPDGFLYHIPFEIMPVNEVASDYSYGDATYLIEKASISYSNSLKDLESSFAHNPRRRYDQDFLGFGITHFSKPESQLLPGRYLPALPLAEKEVQDIASILTSFENNVYHLSHDGTERHFRKGANNSRILHFATHSEVFENDPLYSLIYLNPDEGSVNNAASDGLVYAYELFQMDLANEMVMLNSCESGSGSYIQGSGIVGFSRAFNYAGVQSLVMNLWSVRDRSAYLLSVSFYDYLNQGYSKNEAMRKAKIDYINKTNSNPSYWGSFVVYGNVDPITPSHTPWILALVLLFIGGISLIVTWFRLPKKLNSRR